MKVRIVLYEDFDHWILEKFALKLHRELAALSIDSDIANVPDPDADINHHIIYYPYNGTKNPVDTLMVTHIDSAAKTKRIKNQLQVADLGICMSQQTVDQLAASGIPRDRLCFVSPAHDNVIKPRKTVIGVTTRLYNDGRKKEHFLLDVAKKISPEDFAFKIMGDGWQAIIERLRAAGFSVEYFIEFDYDSYVALVPSFDYYLYFSFDEGSMGFVDALAAGVKTIVTPQGFHLDAPGGITYPIHSVRDAVAALSRISREKRDISSLVSRWTWKDYAAKHVAIWEYLLSDRNRELLVRNRQEYPDGLSSVCDSGEAGDVALYEKVRVWLDMARRSSNFWWSGVKKRVSRITS
jgi:hypothetical protein